MENSRRADVNVIGCLASHIVACMGGNRTVNGCCFQRRLPCRGSNTILRDPIEAAGGRASVKGPARLRLHAEASRSLVRSCSPPGRLAIVMATYNGAAHLGDQIRSIQRQDIADWRLYIRDDGSKDETVPLARGFSTRDPRIILIDDKLGHLGVAGNFASLLKRAIADGAEYVMLADQDDHWRPEKISWQMARVAAAENRFGRQYPLLVHSDLVVTDPHLRPRHGSFMRYSGLRHESRDPLQVLLVQNFVTGCSCVINRALAEVALPLPAEIKLHDWWLALCAASTGAIEFEPRPTVFYRQHQSNSIGATSFWATINPVRKLEKFRTLSAGNEHVELSRQHATALLERLRTHAHQRERSREDFVARLEQFTEILSNEAVGRNSWGRVRGMLKLGVRRQDPLRHALWLLRVALLDYSRQKAA